MKPILNRLEIILLFVDVTAYKQDTNKSSGYSGRTRIPAIAFFWVNLIYWPARWLGADHQVAIYILSALFIFELFLNLVYFKDLAYLAENYYSYYSMFMLVVFNILLIGFALWDFNYMIGK